MVAKAVFVPGRFIGQRVELQPTLHTKMAALTGSEWRGLTFAHPRGLAVVSRPAFCWRHFTAAYWLTVGVRWEPPAIALWRMVSWSCK